MFKAIGKLFQKVKEGLTRTRDLVGGALRKLIGGSRAIDKQFLQELEDTLLAADIGLAKTTEILNELQQRYKAGEVAKGEDLISFLKASLRSELQAPESEIRFQPTGPTVVLIVGVNGAGKTTTIAKLAQRLTGLGKKVLVAAGDTYRAAAIEQLTIWAKRANVDIVKGEAGGDAAAIAYDAVVAAQARGSDVVLIDTAGRLHNKDHLMRELEKIRRVIQKRLPQAPHDVLLVLDATAGQNAVQQAKVFKDSMGVTGLVITKLDGTAKGGVIAAIARAHPIPVRFIGVGEGLDDLRPFVAEDFVAALLGLDE